MILCLLILFFCLIIRSFFIKAVQGWSNILFSLQAIINLRTLLLFSFHKNDILCGGSSLICVARKGMKILPQKLLMQKLFNKKSNFITAGGTGHYFQQNV